MVDVAEVTEVDALARKVARLEMQVRCMAKVLHDIQGALREEMSNLISDRDTFPGTQVSATGAPAVIIDIAAPDLLRVRVLVRARDFKEAAVRLHVEDCFRKSLVREMCGAGVVLDNVTVLAV